MLRSMPSSSTIEDELKSGDEVSFTGFGKFHVADRGAREGRNPRTGETMTIAASRVPRFTAGSGLKKAVKSAGAAKSVSGAGDGSSAPGPASPPFGDRLAAAVAARESQIVLGIDPDPARLWPERARTHVRGRAPRSPRRSPPRTRRAR